MNNMTPTEALQLISEALEPKAQGQISRAGYIAIQQAIETLAKAIKPEPSEDHATND
jgi:predicted RNase H-like HicB family nuclease